MVAEGIGGHASGGKDYQRKLQRVRTSTSTIGVPDAGSNCYLHKGSRIWYFFYYRQFGTSSIIDIKWAALVQVTIASCIGHSNGARACPDPL